MLHRGCGSHDRFAIGMWSIGFLLITDLRINTVLRARRQARLAENRPGFEEAPPLERWSHEEVSEFFPEVRDRRAHGVEHQGEHESQCGSDLLDFSQDRLYGRNLRRWVREHERDSGSERVRPVPSSSVSRRLSARSRSCKGQRDPKLASAFFAQAELDRRQVVRASSTSTARPWGRADLCRCCRSPCRLYRRYAAEQRDPLGVAPGHGVTRH